MIGQLMLLDSGVTVVLADDRGDGWYRAIILHSSNPTYRSDRQDIQVSPSDVERARNLNLTDGVVDMLSWHVEANGPAPTIESLVARINAAHAETAAAETAVA